MKPSAEGLGYSTEKYDESLGLHYKFSAGATLYNTKWKTMVYVSLKQTDSETKQLHKYINYTYEEIMPSYIFFALSNDRFKQIKGTEKLLRELEIQDMPTTVGEP
jgi:hypothetical protein